MKAFTGFWSSGAGMTRTGWKPVYVGEAIVNWLPPPAVVPSARQAARS